MEFRNFTAQNKKGNVLSGASVYVYNTGTTTQVSVFDEDGSGLSQPLSTDSNGRVGFAVANGEYDVKITTEDGSTTLENARFFDPADFTAATSQIEDDAVTIAKIADANLSGADTTIITGTAGTSGNFPQWNADGDMVDSSKAVPTGDVVGSTDSQTLTNKTIDADNNTISNLAHGAEVDNPSSGVHGVTGSVVGTSDTQTLTNKTLDANSNTVSNLAHGAEVDNPSSGVHGVAGSVVGTTDTQTLSNKTLSSPDIDLGSDAEGDVYYRDGSGNFTRLPIGTADQVLTVNTGATAPEWADASGGGGTAGGANAIINGGMQVAQRGTSFTGGTDNADDTYTLDRWYVLSEGNDTVDVTQSTDAPDTNGYSIALDVETTGEKFGIAQIIEADNCIGLIGENVTLSFDAKVSNARIDTVKAAIVAWDGTADSVTSDIVSTWNADGTTPTLIANATFENTPSDLGVTDSYARYEVTASVDTSGANNIIVFIWSDDATNPLAGDFLYISNVQLEIGDVATPFEHRSYGEELALCFRYYWRVSGNASDNELIPSSVGVCLSTTSSRHLLEPPVRMRVGPTASENDLQSVALGSVNDVSLFTTFDTAPWGLNTEFRVDSGTPYTSGGVVFLRTNKSASAYLELDAEL